ncbi:hypothetical protein [Streptomyces sp. NPDC091209]|uniref:hypothetical protein n=1 Tax=Streptomyces sp. NPDC091209 TaxID=3365974 RepID=UPI00380E3E01
MAWLVGCRRLHRPYGRKAEHFLAFAGIGAAFALGIGGTGVADARIQPVDTRRTNSGGNQPGGQQPSWTG